MPRPHSKIGTREVTMLWNGMERLGSEWYIIGRYGGLWEFLCRLFINAVIRSPDIVYQSILPLYNYYVYGKLVEDVEVLDSGRSEFYSVRRVRRVDTSQLYFNPLTF